MKDVLYMQINSTVITFINLIIGKNCTEVVDSLKRQYRQFELHGALFLHFLFVPMKHNFVIV